MFFPIGRRLFFKKHPLVFSHNNREFSLRLREKDSNILSLFQNNLDFSHQRSADFQLIAFGYGSAVNDFGKHSFPRHDAVAHLLKNCTSLVALLTDLG
jgi:hypothetical protein